MSHTGTLFQTTKRIKPAKASVTSLKLQTMSLNPLRYFVQECCITAPATRECGICMFENEFLTVYFEFFGKEPDRDWMTELAVQFKVIVADPPDNHRWDGRALMGIALKPRWNVWCSHHRTKKLGLHYFRLPLALHH